MTNHSTKNVIYRPSEGSDAVANRIAALTARPIGAAKKEILTIWDELFIMYFKKAAAG